MMEVQTMANYMRQRRTSRPQRQVVTPILPPCPLEVEEPMHRYIHHIPAPIPQRPQVSTDVQTSLDYISERLAEENQLLVDILGAINALTAATLSNYQQNS